MPEPASRPPRRFLFLITSSRRDGNSEILAQRAARSLGDGVEQQWVRLLDDQLPPFVDIRHEGVGIYPQPSAAADGVLQATLAATDIVFVSPLYWYGLPTLAKHYLDHWSGWMRVPGVDFVQRMAGKNMWAITALSDPDYSVADPLINTLKLSAGYLQMNWRGVLLGFGNRPAEVLEDNEALIRADSFFDGTAANQQGSAAAHV